MTAQKHKSIDPITWLNSYDLYPKFFWKAKGSDCEIATIGSKLEVNDLSQIDDHKNPFNVVLSFDLDPNKSRIWVPSFELHKCFDETFIVSNVDFPLKKNNDNQVQKSNKVQSLSNRPDFRDWSSSIIKAKKKMKKVVLARRQSILMEGDVCALKVFSKLRKKSKNSFLFFYQPGPKEAFLGSSPETLFVKKDQTIISESIAGTRKRGENDTQDINLKDALLKSEKDLKEFKYVKDYIKSIYEKICVDYEASEIDICKTNWVQHLYVKFLGRLKKDLGNKELIKLFHPTPAVGGTPKVDALDFIKKVELFERNYYAAPIGRASKSFSEFAVGIRSCHIKENQIDTFAGTGIIDSSNAQDEWLELENKSNWIFEVI